MDDRLVSDCRQTERTNISSEGVDIASERVSKFRREVQRANRLQGAGSAEFETKSRVSTFL
jgi:hypothetical protein